MVCTCSALPSRARRCFTIRRLRSRRGNRSAIGSPLAQVDRRTLERCRARPRCCPRSDLRSERATHPTRDWFTFARFVADMFARGPDFERRLSERLRRFCGDGRLNVDTALFAMAWERELTLAAVLQSHPMVYRSEGGDLVTNDRGFGMPADSDLHFYAVSLSPQVGVVLCPPHADGDLELVPDGDSWFVDGIERAGLLNADTRVAWNTAMARAAITDTFAKQPGDLVEIALTERLSLDEEMGLIDGAPRLGLGGEDADRNFEVGHQIWDLIQTHQRARARCTSAICMTCRAGWCELIGGFTRSTTGTTCPLFGYSDWSQ